MLTPKLLRLAHMYEVEGLVAACVDHLKKSEDPERSLEIWNTGEELDIADLKHCPQKCFDSHLKDKDIKFVLICESCQYKTNVSNRLICRGCKTRSGHTIGVRKEC